MAEKFSSSFFQNTDCEYFPCHKTERPEEFNCLFCYCPLYALGEHCGGNVHYTERGVKDCSFCLVPHRKNSVEHIASRFEAIARLAAKDEEK